MVIFKNANYLQFLSEIKEKRIIIFGAGQMCHDFIKCNAEKLYLFEKIDYILDNSPAKAGQEIFFPNKTIKVIGMHQLEEDVHDFCNYIVLILLGENYLLQIVEQLDKIPLFDGISCYYGRTALSWGLESYPPMPVNAVLPKSSGKYRIPKIIHYIWFGRNPMSDIILNCIESWRKYCPDYELRLWNEDNYDLTETPLYVRQAYDAKKYAFVSDYVRLDVVYRYGGFYLDCDVELFRSLDDFLPYKAVLGYTVFNRIGTGNGFGAVRSFDILKNQMSIYNDLFYYSNINIDYINTFSDNLMRKGFNINNTLYYNDDVLIIPSSFFNPFTLVDCKNGYKMPFLFSFSNNTRGFPRFDSQWTDDEIYNQFQQIQAEFSQINIRLLSDWKRTRGIS